MKRGFRKAAKWTVFLILGGALWTPAGAQVGGRATRPQVDLPGGAVRKVILKSCTSCHGIDDYAFFALDRAGWQGLIDTKHKGKELAISDQDRSVLLDWLVTKFGPASTPFPRTYIPPEITTYFTDPEATRLLDRACSSCHDRDRVNQERHPEARWRVITVDLRERGAVLTDEEVEKLVEWLYRTRGTNPVD